MTNEVGEKQRQKDDQAGGRGGFNLDIVPNAGGNEIIDRDENDVKDEGFHGNFPWLSPLPSFEQQWLGLDSAINRSRILPVGA